MNIKEKLLWNDFVDTEVEDIKILLSVYYNSKLKTRFKKSVSKGYRVLVSTVMLVNNDNVESPVVKFIESLADSPINVAIKPGHENLKVAIDRVKKHKEDILDSCVDLGLIGKTEYGTYIPPMYPTSITDATDNS